MAHETPATGEVAVLGEMLELGEQAWRCTSAAARAAAGGVDLLVAVGGAPARALATRRSPPACRATRSTSSSARGGAAVAAGSQPGDLVLVKGSRGTRMDIVADRLAAEGA